MRFLNQKAVYIHVGDVIKIIEITSHNVDVMLRISLLISEFP